MAQRRAMAGQDIPLLQKLRNGWQIFLEHRSRAWGGTAAYVDRFGTLRSLLEEYCHKEVARSRILEIGCGQRAVMPLLFAALGAEAHGVDVEVPTYRMTPRILARVVRVNGLDRAVKSLLRHMLFDRSFFRSIEKAFSIDGLTRAPARIEVMDAAELHYPDDYFDLVFSLAAFEHIENVEAATAHLNRVLRPDGVALVHIHLFPSLSGGHSMEWQHADENPSSKVPPWDHLCENRFPANTYLNRLTMRDYERIFRLHTNPVKTTYSREGLGLIDEIPRELLARYTIEDLTTKGVQYIVRKKR